MSDIRASALQRVFQLLYGPLVFLHEPLGRLAFGRAWSARRAALASPVTSHNEPMLELGCGEGRLLQRSDAAGLPAVGLDLSWQMLRRASSRSMATPTRLVRGDARRLPFRTATFSRVLVSYPGPWIAGRATWDELARVCMPGASVVVLLGGDYRRGPFARMRQTLASLAYGNRSPANAERRVAAQLTHPNFDGRLSMIDDRWGTAVLWIACRRDDAASR